MRLFRHTFLVSLFVLAGGVLLFTGCSDQFLNVTPTNNIAGSEVWKSEGLVNAYLADVYGRLEFQNYGPPDDEAISYLSSANQTLEDAMAGAVRPNQESGWTASYYAPQSEVTQEGVPGPQGWMQFNPLDFWNWDELREANILIKNLQAEGSELSKGFRQEKIAEARWIRAYIYFEKVIRWGGVPIITTPQDPFADSSQVFVKRNTEQEVYDFILKELNEVIDNGALPTSRHGGGRATLWAAHALKSRAMLHAASVAKFGGSDVDLSGQSPLLGIPQSEADRYYQAAYDAAMAVINGPHELYDRGEEPATNYQNLFLTPCEENEEAILCQLYDGNNVGHSWTRQTVPRQARGGVWAANAAVTWDLVEHFGFQEGPYSSQVGGEIDRSTLLNQQWSKEQLFGNRDPRFRGTIIYPGTEWDGETIYLHEATRVDGEVQQGGGGDVPIEGVADSVDWPKSGLFHDREATGLFSVKRTSRSEEDTPRGEDDTNWMEFRLGEMYLNAAEAAFESNINVTGKDAQQLIDDLRARAGMPSQPVSRELIRNERIVEMAIEKQLYWDYRRWRIAHEAITNTTPKGVAWLYDWNDKKYEIREFKNAWGENLRFPKRQYYHPFGSQRIADTGFRENPGY